MKLITPELQARFKEVGDQSEVHNPIFIAKFFDPVGSGRWHATGYDPETNVCYGFVTGLAYDEWGTFSIIELESLELPFGLTIERDLYFKEISVKEVLRESRLTDIKQTEENKDQNIER